MDWEEFFGGSFESEAFYADQQTTVNWYPAKLPNGRKVLLPTPGVEELSAASVGAGRAHFFQNGREFAVIGTALIEIASNGEQTSRGTVTLGNNPATISSNGDLGGQLLITSGGNAYIFDLETNTLTPVTELEGKATMGAYLDGYFLVLDAATSTVYFSNLAPDGEVWDTGEDFFKRSLAADRWAAMAVHDRVVYLIGESTGEAWYDTGQAFPFAPRPEGVFTYGIAAPFSARVMADSLVWLAQTAAGRKVVVRARGAQIEEISHDALETLIEGYDGVESAVADVYSERGHTFYYLNFDGDNITHAYDLATGLWSVRQTWVAGENRFVSWRPRFYAFAFGEHRILDAFGQKLYRMSGSIGTDVDGLPIKRVRRAPRLSTENKRLFFPGLELVMEPQQSIRTTVPAEIVANFSWSQIGTDPPGNDVIFDSSASVGTITDYLWDFGDGNQSTDANPSHYYGEHPPDVTVTVSLTITGPDGVSTTTASVTTDYANGMSGSVEGSGDSVSERPPLVMLRFSNDGGKTWRPHELWRSIGKTGEYDTRIRWHRLGSARKRVFEVSVTDPVPYRVSGAYLLEREGARA